MDEIKSEEKMAELSDGQFSHDTIVVGWNKELVVYCRTFNSTTDRVNMFAAFNYVSNTCDSYVMTSNLNKLNSLLDPPNTI